MDIEQRLRTSLVVPDPGPAFTARVMARLARGNRRRSPVILVGTVLVVGAVAAAAAMLAWRTPAVQPSPEAVAVPEVRDSGTLPEAASVEEPVAPVDLQAAETQASEQDLRPPGTNPAGFSVRVMPLRQETQDVEGRGAAEALYSSMLEELRKVPGLDLHVLDESQAGSGSRADYVLSITSLATSPSGNGGVVVRSSDGNAVYTVVGGSPGGFVFSGSSGGALRAGGEFTRPNASGGVDSFIGTGDPEGVTWVELRVEAGQSPATRYTVPVGASTVRQRCEQTNASLLPECMTPEQLAATRVEVLRLQVFPPDAGFQQLVLAELGNVTLDQAGESQVLNVVRMLATGKGSRMDAGTIRAIARLAAGQPSRLRASIWAMLRWEEVSHPGLAALLMEVLRRDPAQQVRLVALAFLEASYLTEPAVRRAFEAIGREDPDEIVRTAARRSLHGQSQWREEILAALDNPDLSYEARLAPLIGDRPMVSPAQQEHRNAALREHQVLLPLISMVREHVDDDAHAMATGQALALLGSIEDPAVYELFMHVIRETPALRMETTARPNGMDLSGPVSAWVLRHRNDPLVLDALSRANPQLRAMMGQSMQVSDMQIPVPPELAGPPSALVQRMKEVTEMTDASAQAGEAGGAAPENTLPAQ